MPAEEEKPRRPVMSLRTARMEAFSDGVFSIAITLLVLELVVPEAGHPEKHLLRSLVDLWPLYLAYVVSFASIGAAWLAHTSMTEYLDHADSILMRLNLLLLFVVSLLPFPTRMLGDYLAFPNAERVAVTVYGLNLLAITALTGAFLRYAISEGLLKPEAEDTDTRLLTAKFTPGYASYSVAIVIGVLAPRAAVVLYLLIALYLIIPFRTILHHLRHRPDAA